MKAARPQARMLLPILLICTFALAQDTSPNSSLFRNDLAHSGIYASSGAPKLNNIKWTFHTHDEVISSPAIVNGVVYIGSNDGNLYAIDQQTGSQKWKFQTGARVPSSPAVANGLVYFGSYDGNFYAIDTTTGKPQWKFRNAGERRYAATHLHGSVPEGETMPDPFDVYLSSPSIWNNTVYFGSGDGNIYALDAATGVLKWKFKTGDVVHASPAISDGKLYIGSWDSYFYALDAATGKELWRFKTGEDPDIHNQVGIQSSATVDNGVVYFGCRDSKFYALDAATGQKRWSFDNKGSWVISSPVVKDGKVYFATSDTALLEILDAQTGAPVETLKFHWPIFASPSIAGNTLYLAGQDGKLIAIDLTSRKPISTFQSEASRQNLPNYSKPDGNPNYEAAFTSNFYDDMLAGISKLHSVGTILSSPVISGNVVYIGTADGNLYAID
ncbi:PQQ-binding-like beta-propeller repeat protein [Alloacidobacterium dinghuense]|uniref:PQQ-binding-like beta-propeller repeat protein n=1 Tax=Alloacidobacterium dinghuense TaxID=2763107 RepID=A0A7G8BE33_9BACT|nr:PQQ-binding-like beta-propeller repeat protein [Alloacidobacterium dinghuense]QNI30803.1 PQQ-binding-like beta-propeller repeat protein [Alloacidobacterium dinghuense]